MPSIMDTPAWVSLLRHSSGGDEGHKKSSKGGAPKIIGGGGGGSGKNIFKMFKLIPMLTSGCKVVALLGRQGKGLLGDRATTVTLFGYRRGRISMAIQEDPHTPPGFLVELPLLTSALHKEMAAGDVKVALESETRTQRKKLTEEYVWAVFVNGRKFGYSIRRKDPTEEERHVMAMLRGVSMGAGVLPAPGENKDATGPGPDGDLTYMRARFERVVGSKDSEALYMINPDGSGAAELSIFLVRVK